MTLSNWPEFVSALASVENNKNFSKGGWNRKLQRWFPHKSAEGGTDTLAYGHKLSPKEHQTGLLDDLPGSPNVRTEGITDEQAFRLLRADIIRHEQIAEDQWDRFYPANPFRSLDRKFQGVLVNLTFNVGTLLKGRAFGWPNLARRIIAGDEVGVRNGMVTTYVNAATGKRERLTSRANTIADAVGLAR